MLDWQDISTAPKDGTRVLLWYPTLRQEQHIGWYNDTQHISHGKVTYESRGWSIGAMSLGDPPSPTHWMPLPCGPQSADPGVSSQALRLSEREPALHEVKL